jgi:hypothetical protein
MFRTKIGMPAAAALALFVGIQGGAAALAQEAPAAPVAQDAQPPAAAPIDQATRLTKVGSLREARVVNAQGEQIAGISDFAMDLQGRPAYVILRVGGVGAVGGDEIVVPFRMVHFNLTPDNRWTATVDVPQERLKQAPHLEGNGKQLSDRAWLAQNDQFYQPDAVPPAGTPEAGAPSGLVRAGRLADANLRGANDQDVADVIDVVVDQDYTARYLLLGAGGFLGVGKDQVAIPYESVKFLYDQDNDRFVPMAALTKEQLEQAPRLGDKGFSAIGDDDFRRRVREYFAGLAPQQPQP